MKKLTFMLLIIPVLSFSQISENQTGKVELGTSAKSFFIKDEQSYKLNQYQQVFTNAEAIKRIKKARTNKTFASILTYAGSFGIGFGVGYALSVKDEKEYQFSRHDKKTGWTIAGIGAGVTLTSIPLWIGFNKNVKKAIDIENGVSEETNAQLRLNFNGDGMGVAYQF